MNWDAYFLGIAKAVSENGKCRSRKIGAVLVQGKSIVSTGYNGPPSGMRPCDERWIDDNLYEPYGIRVESLVPQSCPRQVLEFPSGQGLQFCVAGHAERNALLQAAKLGIKTDGATLYCYCGQAACKDCAIEIVNAGIKEFVYIDDGSSLYDNLAIEIFNECGVKVRAVEYAE
jgi:dCMP deaminase